MTHLQGAERTETRAAGHKDALSSSPSRGAIVTLPGDVKASAHVGATKSRLFSEEMNMKLLAWAGSLFCLELGAQEYRRLSPEEAEPQRRRPGEAPAVPGPAAGGPEPLPASPTHRWHLLPWCLPQLFLCEEGAATLTAVGTLVLDFPQEKKG